MDKRLLFNKSYFEGGGGYRDGYSRGQVGGYFRALASALEKAVRPRRILDIGCAKGFLVEQLLESGKDARGVDISLYALSCADAAVRQRLVVADIEKHALPFSDAAFDLVTILEVVEHLGSPEFLANEIGRVLVPGGYVLLTTPTPGGRYAAADPTHINVRPRRFWISLFQSGGFEPVRGRTWAVFRSVFLLRMREFMPDMPPATAAGRWIARLGRPGAFIRGSLLPYLDRFSFIRSNETIMFKKKEK